MGSEKFAIMAHLMSEGSGIIPRYDVFGFRLPLKLNEAQMKYLLLQPDNPQEFLRIKREESGWNKLAEAFNQGKCSAAQLRSEVHLMRNAVITNGIPFTVRGKAYLLLCGLSDQMISTTHQESYTNHVNRYTQLPNTNQLKKDINQDLYRTFPDNKWFGEDNNSKKIQMLERVLGAFALHNPAIGYCQSMNFVAAFLLIIFDFVELPAFLIFSNMIETILNGYYSRSLIRIMADMVVLQNLVAERLPRLSEHFAKHNVSIPLFVPNWFMSGFTSCLPSVTVAQCWDWMLMDHDLWVVFRVALGILCCVEEYLLQLDGTDEIVQYLKQPCLLDVVEDSKQFMSIVHQTVKRVPLKSLKEMRDTAYETERQEFDVFQNRKDMLILERSTHFDRDELAKLKELFMKDTNEDGLITLAQLESILLRLRTTKRNPELRALYLQIFERKGTQLVEFTELAAALSVIFKGSPLERLKLCFQVFDTENKGSLDRSQVNSVVDFIYRFFYGKKPADSNIFVERLFSNCDTEKSGRLSFSEFEKILLLDPKLARCFLPTSNSRRQTVDEIVVIEEPASLPSTGSIQNTRKKQSRAQLVDSLPSIHGQATTTSMSRMDTGSCCAIS